LTSEGNAEIMVYSCGPEFMIKGVLDTCRRFKLPVEVSLERYMHCGIGICGFCTINGLRVCKDGPVFSGKQLRDVKDLGKFRKTSSGKNEAF
jgi:dihydroorotate dehydrogenase electron transfer subunit